MIYKENGFINPIKVNNYLANSVSNKVMVKLVLC